MNKLALNTIPEDMQSSNPIHLFNSNWVHSWKETQNFRIFNARTDDRLFDLFPPKHIYNGADTLSLLQQRFLATFHNLKRSGSNTSSDKNGHQSEEDAKDQESINSRKSISQTAVNPEKNTEKSANHLWNSWKEYFNKSKNATNGDITGSTEDLKNRGKTKNAIQKAMMGLGLHYTPEGEPGQEEKEEENDEDEDNDDDDDDDEEEKKKYNNSSESYNGSEAQKNVQNASNDDGKRSDGTEDDTKDEGSVEDNGRNSEDDEAHGSEKKVLENKNDVEVLSKGI